MSSRPWYKRFPSDFISGTISLTLEEAGAYSYIIDLIHDRGGPIPDDPQWIARVCGCSTRKWKSIRESLIQAGKISEVDGLITQKRAENDTQNWAKEGRNLAENGSKGGRKPSEKKVTPSKNNNLTGNRLKHSRSQKPEAIKIKKKFEEFWKRYPRKIAKPKALESYRKSLEKVDHEQIMRGVEYYIQSKPDYADWAHPTTWLNGERWGDSYSSVPEKTPEQAADDKRKAEKNKTANLKTEISEALARCERFDFNRDEMLAGIAKQNGVPLETVKELAA